MIDPRQTLADFTFASKYARYLPDQRRRETYEEAVKRMMNMHRAFYADKDVDKEINFIEEKLLSKAILGSQRALQFGGDGVLRKNMRLYNCSYSFCDRPRFFAEALWLLLCGCGVGFSVQKHHVAALPEIKKPSNPEGTIVYPIADSIEGWAAALNALITSYMNPSFCDGKPLSFDYSYIRPEGSPISSSSGKAPGPKPLRDSLEAVRVVLNRVAETTKKLRPIDAYDIVMHASNCVRAGGIRRSATIALFSPDDVEMTNAKTGDWWQTNPQRRLSNNSAHFVRATASYEQFKALIASTKEFGEPGFFFANSTEHGTNPCAEIGLEPTINGKSGWAFCNLTSVNVGACKTEYEFFEACTAAAWLGTLQAGYMDVGWLDRTTQDIMLRDALLGVSLTGMADNPAIAFSENTLRLGSKIAVVSNEGLAERIGIKPAARVTTVKPEGTGSLVLKVGNGIHPHHARRYLRYVEAGKITDPLVKFMAEQIPEAVVPSAYAKDEFKVVFPIDLGDGALWLKAETDPIDHLTKVRSVQDNWVKTGTNRGDLTHNVSNTIQVPNDRWNDVAEEIWKHRDSYGGVSLLGTSGDLDYAQAPFVEVLLNDAEIYAKYSGNDVLIEKAKAARDLWLKLRAAWKEVDFKDCVETVDNSAGLETVACAGGACAF